MPHHPQHNRITQVLYICGAVLLGLCIGVGVFFASGGLLSFFQSKAADYFVSHCSGASDKALCYETSVPKLRAVLSVENIFPVIRQIQREDPSYRFCHVLGHQIGINEVKRDPDHWMNIMHKNPPDSLCSNGFIHGVIVGKFHNAELPKEQIDAIVPDLSRACEATDDWHPTNLDRGMCYHGMGHVLTFITGAKLSLAVSYCKQIAKKTNGEDYSGVCESGVFMQIFQPLEPEDYDLINKLSVKPTKQNLAAFCGAYPTEEERSYCFGEGWPLFREELQSAKGMQSFCESGTDRVTKENCYRTVFAIGARGSIGDPSREMAVCSALPSARAADCINVLANAFIEEDRTRSADAVAVCRSAPHEYTDSCLEYLIKLQFYNFIPGTKEAAGFCAALPPEKVRECTVAR